MSSAILNDYTVCGDPEKRHDFILLFDVTDGNPNGDPDAGNMPRIDPETMQGLVTDVCIKRKVRNFVTLSKAGEKSFEIYVNDQGVALNDLHQQAYNEDPKIKSTGVKQNRDDVHAARQRMCRRFFDVRMFGAVMTTGINAGQVRGPLQLTFARSVSPVVPMDVAITRVAITKPEDARVVESEAIEGKSGSKTTEMGSRPMVPYGLYVGKGFFSAPFATQTGVKREDLELFWAALTQMWDLDHSASRGMMACRGLYVFSHDNGLGNAPAHTLFERLNASLKPETKAPRNVADYNVSVNTEDLPNGVTLTKLA